MSLVMRRSALVLVLLLAASGARAQLPIARPYFPDNVGGPNILPAVIREVRPRYTADARKAKIQGSVVVEFVVAPDGTVDDVRVVESLDREHGLDDEAVKAAKQWLFVPGRQDVKPVRVVGRLELLFNLADAATVPSAQRQKVGAIRGRAVLADSGLVPGVTVTVTAGRVRRTTITDAAGEFRIDDLPPGPYRVEGNLPGFRTAVIEAVPVVAGGTAPTTLVMRTDILGHVDYALPADGVPGALRAADVVVHLRILASLGPALLGPGKILLATQHAATVLQVVKCPPPGVAVGDRIQFWQHMAGEWREEGRLIVGPQAPYATGQEFVAFLKDDPQWGGRAELAGFHLMFPIRDGVVHGVREAADGLRDGMKVSDFLAVLERLRQTRKGALEGS